PNRIGRLVRDGIGYVIQYGAFHLLRSRYHHRASRTGGVTELVGCSIGKRISVQRIAVHDSINGDRQPGDRQIGGNGRFPIVVNSPTNNGAVREESEAVIITGSD